MSEVVFWDILVFLEANKTYKDATKGTSLYNQRVKKDAIQLVNKILAKGREEGSTPAQRLKAIVNTMEGEKIPKNTFAKFFTKEELLEIQTETQIQQAK